MRFRYLWFAGVAVLATVAVVWWMARPAEDGRYTASEWKALSNYETADMAAEAVILERYRACVAQLADDASVLACPSADVSGPAAADLSIARQGELSAACIEAINRLEDERNSMSAGLADIRFALEGGYSTWRGEVRVAAAYVEAAAKRRDSAWTGVESACEPLP